MSNAGYTWRQRAAAFISKLQLPANIDGNFKSMRAWLRDERPWEFNRGWPLVMFRQETRRYLGLPVKVALQKKSLDLPGQALIFEEGGEA
jgi:hypothetical protein